MMRTTILLVSLLATACAQFQDLNNVCADNQMPNKDPTGTLSPPKFATNWKLVLEQTMLDKKRVQVMELDYSQKDAKMHMLKMAYTNESELWIDAKRNMFLSIGVEEDVSKGCAYKQLDLDTTAKFLNFYTKAGGTVSIGPSEDVLHFHTNSQKKVTYVGKGSTRGIPTDMWQICQAANSPSGKREVMSVVFHFADKTLTTPMKTQPLLSATSNASIGSDFIVYRYDYVNMRYLPQLESNFLLPPPDTYCIGEKLATNLPKMPNMFSFKTEVIDLGNPSEFFAIPTISYTRQEYLGTLGLYTMISLRQSAGDGYGDVLRIVHDFNLKLSYTVDVVAGSCLTSNLQLDGYDDTLGSNGTIRMRDPQGIFYLDLDYQYVGVRQHESRGIDCDVWISSSGLDLSQDRQRFIWYFATNQWQMKFGIEKPQPLPISLEILTSNRKTIYNVFEYTPKPFNAHPDYSACFNQIDSIRMAIELTGGTFHQTYLGNAMSFKKSFVFALMQYGHFPIPSRIIEIDVKPAQTNSLLVTFMILGNPIGQDLKGIPYPSPEAIYQSLKDNIKGSRFSFDIKDEGGATHGSLKATNIGRVSGQADSFSAGYGSGDMAGLGLGLLLVGLVVGFAAVYLIYRIRKYRGSDNMGVKMQPMPEE